MPEAPEPPPDDRPVREVEGEVVGFERDSGPREPGTAGGRLPPSPLKRLLARGVVGVLMGLAGLLLSVLGGLLILTFVGAAVGLPLLLVGMGLVIAAFLVLFGAGTIRSGPQGGPPGHPQGPGPGP